MLGILFIKLLLVSGFFNLFSKNNAIKYQQHRFGEVVMINISTVFKTTLQKFSFETNFNELKYLIEPEMRLNVK